MKKLFNWIASLSARNDIVKWRRNEKKYDLTVDTSNASVFDIAKEIITFIENNPDPKGFNNMRGTLA